MKPRMRLVVSRSSITVLALALCASGCSPSNVSQDAHHASWQPDLAYAAHGKLWLRSLGSGVVRRVGTPWAVTGLLWSPDGGAIAFAGKRGIGVVDLRRRIPRAIFSRALHNCCGERTIWSPNGKFLAFFVDTKSPWLANLWLWNRITRRARFLLRVSTVGFSEAAWAHDSRRIALAVGTADTLAVPARNPRAEIVDIYSRHVTTLGNGLLSVWSPDDRLLGFDHLTICGASACFLHEGIVRSSGGATIRLDRGPHTKLTYEFWAPRRPGYAYDRWLLDSNGHVTRRIPGRFANVESWSPDGHWVAVRSISPSLRVILTLIAADTGRSKRIFVSSPTGSCDACLGASYELNWKRDSSGFAMLSPDVGGTPAKEVQPSLYYYTLRSGHGPSALSKGVAVSDPYPTLIGWADHQREVILLANRRLFRYLPRHPRLIPLAVGLPSSLNYLGDGYGMPAVLRQGS